MANIEATSTHQSHLLRPPLGRPRMARFGSHQAPLPAAGAPARPTPLRSADSLLPSNKTRSAIVIYSARAGTTLAYIGSMLAELARTHRHRPWSFGAVLAGSGGSSSATRPRDRIQVNGEPVDGALFEQCCRDHELEIGARFAGAAAPGRLDAASADAMLVNIALRLFERLDVTTVVVAAPCPAPAPGAPGGGRDPPGSAPAAAGPQLALWGVERLVMELFRPKVVVCGLEPLPAYQARLPDDWRRGMVYLTRSPVHIVSAPQPSAVRMQLRGLAKVFSVAVEFAQPLSAVPACRDAEPGIFGPGQRHYAALALAACQAWACGHGLIRPPAQTRAAEPCAVHAPARAQAQAQATHAPQSPLLPADSPPAHEAPPWMARGLAAARCPGLFHTLPSRDSAHRTWHCCWAETPADFSRAGSWFGEICEARGPRPRVLLISLPGPALAPIQYQDEADGRWLDADYRELLHSLHAPLRHVPWELCVFVAAATAARGGSGVAGPAASPTLPQYVLREFWAQATGLPADQIAVAPSLAAAHRIVELRQPSPRGSSSPAAARAPALDSPGAMSPRPPQTPWTAQILRPSPSASSLALPSARSPNVFGRPLAMSSSTSVDTLGDPPRRRPRPPALGSMSAASLPLRTHPADLPPAQQPGADVLVVGSRAFVQSALRLASLW
ncbi:hypothetical protein H4R18_002875 [Coemansia javaensis]|uniref:Uncharacterized protein n=1 Tax=Coemansia javaensis TaxID=2761396 RepID=A0A9W8LIJ2_9FUNG|nr:hypothetical protein H4R18_002875 [Coemansia javaensis]